MPTDPRPLPQVTAVDYDPFATSEIARTVPSSPAQREIWLATRLSPEASLAYNESVSLRFRGDLDLAAMRGALQDLVARHDALRSTFSSDGLTLCVSSTLPFEAPLLDLSTLASAEGEARLDQRLVHHVLEPFSLERGPLVRAEIVRRSREDHVVILSAHHIVCDGWSFWVLTRELAAFYEARTRGVAASLPKAESFADYALSEASPGRAGERAADESYWLGRFSDEVAALDLPADAPRPPVKTFRSERLDHPIGPELTRRLKSMGAKNGASFFTTLLAAFKVLLFRLSGQDDLVVGIPAAGQSVGGHDTLVGHCVNVLPLRSRLDPGLRFDEVLKALRTTMLDAYEHQQYTYGTLLQKLPMDRDPGRLPLVSVLFNIDQALADEARRFPGLALEFQSNPRRYENFELFVNAMEIEGAVRLECQFNRDLFEPATIGRWLAAYETLLAAFAASPTLRVGEAPLLSEGEVLELGRWNETGMEYVREACVHELMLEGRGGDSERVALEFEGRELTYGELERRSNGMARRLRESGVKRGSLVGLCVERSPEMVVGLLGILKAGGGYVPLDPGFPKERLLYMVGDSGMRVLVTTAELREELGLEVERVLCVEEEGREDEGVLTRDVDSAGPEDVAYVIYTSGSTGKPKGVEVPHRAVVNFLTSMREKPGLGREDRLVAVTTLSFDIAVLELQLPLVVGARVILASREVATDGERLRELLERSKATVMQATPATWRLLFEAGWRGSREFKALVGGEALPREVAEELLERAGEVWNLYGPTETTVWSTCWKVEKPVETVLIGRPIGNTRVYVLDGRMQKCPIGVPGELWIGGDGLARGYRNRPELTGERFCEDPFRPGQGERLYRTGDLARFRSDGNLECLGRTDFQVKVRGYRIELGEIESTLATHETVSQAAVVARPTPTGETRLVAYVVPSPGRQVDESDLRRALAARLPEYMLPARFLTLSALPLTPNGKVDRRALPDPGTAPAESGADFVGPRSTAETLLTGIWQDLLCLPRVSVHDDFFRLGGHSLLAAQMVSRLNREHGVVIPLRKVFEARTIEALAVFMGEGRPREVVRIPRRPPGEQAPLSLMQQRLWFLEELNPGSVVHNVPSAHRLLGRLDVPALQRALQEMVRRQSALRTVLRITEDGTPVQIVQPEVAVELAPVDLSELEADARERRLQTSIEEEIARPFDLSRGPLFRARLFRLGEEEHALFFMAHHIVWDGWCFDLFYDEISTLYGAFAKGEASPLEELPVSYGDFAAWQREELQGPELERQVDYWRQKLEGRLDPLEVPADRPRPAAMTNSGSTEWIRVDATLAEALRTVADRAGATLFMVLLAAYEALLHRHTGRSDFLVGVPVRGRSQPETERIMGFFVNALAHTRPGRRAGRLPRSPRGRCKRRASRRSITRTCPIERLIQDLKVPRDASRPPLYQVFFSFQDARARPKTWGGVLRHQRIAVNPPSAAQDLGLWFVETREGLVGGLNYNTDIFDATTIRRLLDEYKVILKAILEAPDRSIASLPLLSEGEVLELGRWNETGMEYVREACVHELMLEGRGGDSERVALEFEGRELTYGELERRSNGMARRLRESGVKRGSLVGLCVERSPEMVVGLLGILKAGGGYVPLDPGFPKERLLYMVGDSGMRVLVTTAELREELGLEVERVLCVEEEGREDEGVLTRDVDSAGPEDVAYVIYTSGSTGKPKGVEVPHRAVVNFLTSMREKPGLGREDRLVAVTTLSFDIAVLELQLPLVVGARVILASREVATDGERLRELLERSKATVMQATPATWRLLFEAGWRGSREFKALVGGEALPREVAEELLERAGEVWNLYGPTETTVWSTCWKVEKPVETVLIGRPIGNTRVYVLDGRMQKCPIGVPGELWIGGDGVARGYRNRPELTGERFCEDPFRPGQGERAVPDGRPGAFSE